MPAGQRREAQKVLARFCDRVSSQLRDKIAYSVQFRGNSAVILEGRPSFTRPTEWTQLKMARFTFEPTSARWSLQWADQNERWHPYQGMRHSRRLEVLLAEVERDPTGIFFG
jgi:hypothetical protein